MVKHVAETIMAPAFKSFNLSCTTETVSDSNDVVDMLLQGAFDTHIHGSPDIVPRKMSDFVLAQSAKMAGIKGIVLKNHVTPTTSRAKLVQEAVGDLHVFGGLVLNREAGGLNPAAVETELALGAKEIWMPTKSSVNELTKCNGDLTKSVPLTNEEGAFRPELFDILDLIAKEDAILGTGHLAANEIEKLVTLAKNRGVQRIIITHPEYELPKMPIDMQKRLARQGVMFERCFFACNPPMNLPLAAVVEQIKATGAELSIMATDFGQLFNDDPVAGFRRYIRTMLELGTPPEDIETMVKKNPAQIFGV